MNDKPYAGYEERNYLGGPRGDKLAWYVPFNDARSGSTTTGALSVVGRRIEAPFDAPAPFDTNGTWVSTEGGGIDSNDTSYVVLGTAATDYEYNRGTILIRVHLNELSGTILNMGSDVLAGIVRIYLDGGNIKVYHTLPSSVMVDEFSASVAADATYTIIYSWGEKGRHFWVNGVEQTPLNSSDTYTDPLSVPNTSTVVLGRRAANRVDAIWLGFGWWDWQLEDKEIAELFTDAYIPIRNQPTSLLATDVGATIGRVTSTSATFNVVTSDSLSEEVQLRVIYGTDKHLGETGGTAPTTSSAESTSTADEALELTISDLSANTTYYWVAQYNYDDPNLGLIWYNLPGSRGKFVTQRPAGETFTFSLYSDTHFSTSAPGYVEEGGAYAYGRVQQDIYRSDSDFWISLGDDYYTSSADENDQLQNWRREISWVNKTGPGFFVLGNHEDEAGYFQNREIVPVSGDYNNQMTNTIGRKKYVLNPDNTTYPEGGENEGNEIDAAGNDWIPALDATYDATWRNTYIGYSDSSGRDSSSNKSPLENYYAWTWGDCLFIVLDPYRYSLIGEDRLGNDFTSAPYQIGEEQWSWLENLLANSTSKWKVVLIHQFLGGRGSNLGWYGRGSGTHIAESRLNTIDDDEVGSPTDAAGSVGIIDELRLHNLCREYEVTAVFTGHDHTACHVIKDSVNYLSCASGNVSLFFASLVDMYGTTGIQGSDLASLGLQWTYKCFGYYKCTVSPTQFKVELRQVSCMDKAVGDFSQGATQAHDYIGEVLTGDGSEVEVDEIPHSVFIVCSDDAGDYSDADGVDNTSPVEDDLGTYNLYTTPFSGDGASYYDEPYVDTTIPYNGGSGIEEVRVNHAPRTLVTMFLSNATPASLPTGNSPNFSVLNERSGWNIPIEDRLKFKGNETVLAVNNVQKYTDWRFFREFDSSPDIQIRTTSAGVSTPNIGNVSYATKDQIYINLNRTTDWFVQYRVDGGEWSQKHKLELRPRSIQPRHQDSTIITKTSRGATVRTTNPQWTETKTDRGVRIVNNVYTDE